MPDIHVLIKPASGLCNLNCEYCFYHDEMKNREVGSYGFMSEETLENVIKKVIEFSETSCTIAYQGGEPCLRGLDFFQKAAQLEKKYNTKGLHIHHTIQTNGTLIDEEWAKFFKKNHFLLGISLDGMEFVHDSFRKDTEGRGTFRRVMEGVDILNKYKVDYNILTVVNAVNAKKASQIYDFYKKCGFEYLQFIPCLQPLGKHTEKYPFTLTPKAFAKFMNTLFDCWYQDIKNQTYISIQPFEGYVQLLMREQPLMCGLSGICSFQHVVEADGEVYPCDFYVLDEYRIGNLNECSIEEINKRRKKLHFVEDSALVSEKCRQCKFYPLCRGGCRRQRVPDNMFCEAYYEFFDYTLERFEEIALLFTRIHESFE